MLNFKLADTQIKAYKRVSCGDFDMQMYHLLTQAPSTRIGIFLNCATFSFRIWLPSTRIRRTQQQIRILFKSALLSGKNKSVMNPITCGRVNPDTFESDDVAKWCPVSYRTINQYGGTTATPEQICRHFRALYGACSEHILLPMNPGYYSESGYHWTRVDTRIRFEYATCGRGNF